MILQRATDALVIYSEDTAAMITLKGRGSDKSNLELEVLGVNRKGELVTETILMPFRLIDELRITKMDRARLGGGTFQPEATDETSDE